MRALVLLVTLVAAASLTAAPPQQDALNALAVGQVIDASSERPVAGAIVAIVGPTGASGQPHPRVITGADGRFYFAGLRGGRYTITATKTGYSDGAYGRFRPLGASVPFVLNPGQRRGDATLRLWKHAAISGTVVDETGERLIGVPVRAYRRTAVAGQMKFVAARSATTDDRGIYRIGGLVPGQYLVGTSMHYQSATLAEVRDATTRARSGVNAGAATALSMTNSEGFLTAGDGGVALGRGNLMPPPTRAGLEIYPPTYHPSATGGQSASVISIESGQEYEGADLRITPVATVPVSGIVVGPNGGVRVAPLRLISGSGMDDVLENNWLTASTDQGGRFSFPAVPPGNYRLRLVQGQAPAGRFDDPAVSGMVWVDHPLSVGVEPINDLAITAQPGLRIQGRFEFESTSNRPINLAGLQVSIEPAEPDPGSAGAAYLARVDAQSRTFMSPSLPAGRYYVRVPNSPAGWMFLGANADGRDIADTPLLVSAELPNVVVTFTDRWSGLSGSVQRGTVRDGAALVLIFPSDTDAWGSTGSNARRTRAVRTGAGGDYSANLPPGDYYVVAVPDERSGDWQDPVFMTAAAQVATRVIIGPGERKVQDLRTRTVR